MFADQLGSARVVTNSSGTIQDDSDFYAFGGERVVSSASGNVYKFEGKERDGESGLDDFGARYYSSRYGRFVSADWSAIPVAVPYADLTNPQTLNLYAIVHDNPETFADLDGHCGSPEGCYGYDPNDPDKKRPKNNQPLAQKQQQDQQYHQALQARYDKLSPPQTEASRQQALTQGVTGADAGVKAGLAVEGAGVAIVTGAAAAPAVVSAAATVTTTVTTTAQVIAATATTVVSTTAVAARSLGVMIENYIPGGIETLHEVQSFVGGYTNSSPPNSPSSIGGTLGSITNFYDQQVKPLL